MGTPFAEVDENRERGRNSQMGTGIAVEDGRRLGHGLFLRAGGRLRRDERNDRMIPLDEASAAVIEHCQSGSRVLLGLAGEPGAGKSTAAARLLLDADQAGVTAAVVPMDGFHLAHSVLESRAMTDVKGAPETFDAHGFVALVERIHAQRPGDPTIWAPEFRREIEDAVAGAIEVPADTQLVIVEGNYVLLDEEPWARLALLFDVAWMLTPSAERRLARLMARHESYGNDPADARRRALGPDQTNAERVRAHSQRPGVTMVDPG